MIQQHLETPLYYKEISIPNFSNNTILNQVRLANILFTVYDDNSINKNKDYEDLSFLPVQENNQIIVISSIFEFNYSDLVVEFDTLNQDYLYSSSGLIYLEDVNYNRNSAREILQYKSAENTDFIDFTYNEQLSRYELYLEDGIFLKTSLNFRLTNNIGVEQTIYSNDKVFVIDKSSPHVELIRITDPSKISKTNIIKKGETFTIRIKFNENISVYEINNIINNIYVNIDNQDQINDVLLETYGSLTGQFLDVSDNQDNLISFETSNKFSGLFKPNNEIQISNPEFTLVMIHTKIKH